MTQHHNHSLRKRLVGAAEARAQDWLARDAALGPALHVRPAHTPHHRAEGPPHTSLTSMRAPLHVLPFTVRLVTRSPLHLEALLPSEGKARRGG